MLSVKVTQTNKKVSTQKTQSGNNTCNLQTITTDAQARAKSLDSGFSTNVNLATPIIGYKVTVATKDARGAIIDVLQHLTGLI